MARLTAAFSLDGQTTVRIPPAFFSDLGRQQFAELMSCRGGVTNAAETKQLWRLLHRRDTPPKGVLVIVSSIEALALYPPGWPGSGSIASALDLLWADFIEN